MDDNKLARRYISQLVDFDRYLGKIREGQGIRDIHRLRVSIKKLRAIWRFQEKMMAGNWKKKAHADQLEKLFRTAGKLREIQVNVSLAEKCDEPGMSSFLEYLDERKNQLSRKLIQRMDELDAEKWERLNSRLMKNMNQLTDEFVRKESVRNLLDQNSQLMEMYAGSPDKPQLHKIRILFRDMQELLVISKGLHSAAAWKEAHHEIKKLNLIIGKWHDYDVLLNSLYSFVRKYPEKAPSSLKRSIKALEMKQELRQAKVKKRLSKYTGLKALNNSGEWK